MTTQTTNHGDLVVAATRHLFDSGVMSHAGHANLSARLDDERFTLTTTAMVRDLRADQLATVNLDGEVLEGVLGPENAEIIAMHSVIYKARREVGGIIHTHSPSATAFALANKEPPCRAEPLLRFGQAEPVPVVAGRGATACGSAPTDGPWSLWKFSTGEPADPITA